MAKHKFYIWTVNFSGLPLATHLQDEGEDVTMVMIHPTREKGKIELPKTAKERRKNQERIDYLNKNGSGLVKKIWAPEAMQLIKAGDYVIFDQIYGWQYGEALHKRGAKVFGGSKVGYVLETERRQTLKLLGSLGYDIPFQKDFGPKSSEKAIQYLESIDNEKLFVLKSDNCHVLTTVADYSNDELIQAINAEKEEIDADGLLLQEKVDGIEYNIETWVSNGTPILCQINLEEKRKFNNTSKQQIGCSYDLVWTLPIDHPLRELVNKPLDKFAKDYIGTGLIDLSVIHVPKEEKIYALEMCGCFDPETEALTRNGWKKYLDINLDDEVLSINPETKDMAWKPIKNIQVYPYRGPMVKLGNNGYKAHSSFDAMVTPNHRWLIQNNGKKLKISETHNLKNGHQIIRSGNWQGVDTPTINIPAYTVSYILKKGTHLKGGRYGVYPFTRNEEKTVDTKTIYPELNINTTDFFRFIGIYLAEGSTDSFYDGVIPRRITISQFTNMDKVEDILKKLPFTYTQNKSGYRISSIQLGKYLYDKGLIGKKSNDKFIPNEFKQYAPEYLEALLDGFVIGDGHIKKGSNWVSMCTTSSQLADDLQEIIHKIGWVANVSLIKVKDTEMIINGNGYIRNHDQYTISIRKSKTAFQIYRTNNTNLNYREVAYTGPVWCLEVEDWHTFFVRRNGKAYFSGNSRLGYNQIYSALCLLNIPIGEFFKSFLDGKYTDDVGHKIFKQEFAASLRVLNDGGKEDSPITYPEELKQYYWIWDCWKKGSNLLTVGGKHGEELGMITDHADTPEGAFAKVRELYNAMYLSTLWARDDYQDDATVTLPLARYHELKKLDLI